MTAAEIEHYNTNALTGQEAVRLNADDAETYVSRKFDVILGVDICKNANDDAHINATWSGKTVTINYASGSSDDVSLIVYGKTGP